MKSTFLHCLILGASVLGPLSMPKVVNASQLNLQVHPYTGKQRPKPTPEQIQAADQEAKEQLDRKLETLSMGW